MSIPNDRPQLVKNVTEFSYSKFLRQKCHRILSGSTEGLPMGQDYFSASRVAWDPCRVAWENLALQKVHCDTGTFCTKMLAGANVPYLQKRAILILILNINLWLCIIYCILQQAHKWTFKTVTLSDHFIFYS